jgi:hypothetical protein
VLRWVDVSRYQVERPDPLDLAQAKAAGYSIANVALTGGRGYISGSWAKAYLARAAELDMGRSTYHWLDGRTSGRDQAAAQLTRLRNIVGSDLRTVAHCVDVEETGQHGVTPPTWQHVVDYVWAMQDALGKFIAIYSGDWWWKPKAWAGESLTPYLMGMPNAGALKAYPGDASPHWTAGWGGWPEFSVMQWGVAPLPGTGKCSLSVIRDHAVWIALSGGTPAVSYAPDTILDARKLVMDTLRSAGVTVNPASFGVVGDDSHANAGTGYHLGKDALKTSAYSIVESSRDRNGLTNAASAFDWGNFSITVKGRTHNLRTMSRWMVAECQAGAPDAADIREIIYSPDGKTVKRWDRLGIRSTGDGSHTGHTHFSWFRDSEKRDKTALFRRYFISIGLIDAPEEDMPLTAADVKTLATADIWPAPPVLGIADGTMSLQDMLTRIFNRAEAANNTVNALRAAFQAFVTAEQGDDAARAAALDTLRAKIEAIPDESAEAVLDRLADEDRTDADIAAALRAAFGDRAPAIAALMAEPA